MSESPCSPWWLRLGYTTDCFFFKSGSFVSRKPMLASVKQTAETISDSLRRIKPRYNDTAWTIYSSVFYTSLLSPWSPNAVGRPRRALSCGPSTARQTAFRLFTRATPITLVSCSYSLTLSCLPQPACKRSCTLPAINFHDTERTVRQPKRHF